jgi:hypothetical protein
MGLDLRFPIGGLFLAYGVILAGYGLFDPQLVQGTNVNLVWGIVMAVFGGTMLWLARGAGRPREPQPGPKTRPTGN